MILILTEKNSLAKTMSRALNCTYKDGYYGNDEILIAEFRGHLLRQHFEHIPYTKANLPLPMDKVYPVENRTDDHINRIIDTVKKLLSRDDIEEIVSLGDPDLSGEGSLLIYEMLEYCDVLDKCKITRMWNDGESESALLEAYNKRYDISQDMPYITIGKVRSYFDLKQGISFSRAFTLKEQVNDPGFVASIGRVRTPVLQIVAYRENEIKNFIPTKYYNITGIFGDGLEGVLTIPNTDIEAKNKTTTRIDLEYYKNNQLEEILSQNLFFTFFTISKMESKDAKVNSELLPSQAIAIKEIGNLYGIASDETTKILQFLYENHFSSYPRTDFRYISPNDYEKANKAFEYIKDLYSDQIRGNPIAFSRSNHRIFDDGKTDKDDNSKSGSHPPIIPWFSNGRKTKEDLEKLTPNQKKVYDYIAAKFLMACMKPYVYQSSTIELLNDQYNLTFIARGQIEKSKGFKDYDFVGNKTKEDKVLPPVDQNEPLRLNRIIKKQESTSPPPLFKDTDLVELMDNINKLYEKMYEDDEDLGQPNDNITKFSIGTSATREGIINELIKKYKYLRFNSKGQLLTTATGRRVLEIVGKAIDLQTTAQLEEDMRKILKDVNYAQIVKEKADQFIQKVIDEISQDIPDAPENKILEGLTCPLCDHPLLQTSKTIKCEDNHFVNNEQTGCRFSFMRDQSKFFGRELELKDIEYLLKKSSKENPLVDNAAGIYLDLDNQYFISVVFDESSFYETDKTYKKGDQWIYKSQRMKNLTAKEAQSLLNGETITLTRKSKVGKPYRAEVRLSDENNGTLVWTLKTRQKSKG
jgi:DNA topoisomerase III